MYGNEFGTKKANQRLPNRVDSFATYAYSHQFHWTNVLAICVCYSKPTLKLIHNIMNITCVVFINNLSVFVGCWIFKGDTWGTGRSQYGYRIDNIIQATRTKSSHLYWAQQISMEFSFSIHSPFNFLQYCIIQCHCHYLWQQYYFTIAVGEWHLHFQCRAVVEFSMKAWNI